VSNRNHAREARPESVATAFVNCMFGGLGFWVVVVHSNFAKFCVVLRAGVYGKNVSLGSHFGDQSAGLGR
jgi:hypothetical protein